MRIAICAFRQESNSFNPVPSGLDFYERGAIFEGQAMYDVAKEKQGTVGAMVEAVEKEGVKPEMLCFMSANPGCCCPGIDMLCSLEGNHLVGTVLILAVLAGLALCGRYSLAGLGLGGLSRIKDRLACAFCLA